MKIEQNYTQCNISSRGGYSITLVVIHHTASSNINGTIAWFKNPKASASAHYVIGLDGCTVAMVPEDKKAWHAGQSIFQGQKDKNNSVNSFSVGIELVGDGNSAAYTEQQYQALIELCKTLRSRYKLSDQQFTGHEFVAPARKNDPGKFFDWKRFMHGICNQAPPSFITSAEDPDSATYRNIIKNIALANRG